MSDIGLEGDTIANNNKRASLLRTCAHNDNLHATFWYVAPDTSLLVRNVDDGEMQSQADVMFPMASVATTAFGMDVRKYE